MKSSFTWKRGLTALFGMLMLVLADQWTKHLAVLKLMGQEPFVIIKGVFQLRYLENNGAAFGMMQGKQWFFIFMAFIVVLVAAYYYFRMPWEKKFNGLRLCALAIVSGAIGNLIDRLTHTYVIDFFYIELIDFPIFNVADLYVSFGTAILVVLILFFFREEELECLFPSKSKEKK